jgi:hypothetical protein
MNPFNGSPLDPTSAAALVARVIVDIDESDEETRGVLMSELCLTAWGSVRAQAQ